MKRTELVSEINSVVNFIKDFKTEALLPVFEAVVNSIQAIEDAKMDTATLLTQNNKKYKVRFYGIDAPEAAQNFGMVSRDNLRKKILGQDVTLKVVSQDRYGRVVCKVMFRGRYINREMVSEGMAWYYADYAKNEYELSLAQEEARSSAAGLWKNSDPQPPWEWRKAKKKK